MGNMLENQNVKIHVLRKRKKCVWILVVHIILTAVTQIRDAFAKNTHKTMNVSVHVKIAQDQVMELDDLNARSLLLKVKRHATKRVDVHKNQVKNDMFVNLIAKVN